MGQGRARRRQAHRSIRQKRLKHSLRVERGETRPSKGDGEGWTQADPTNCQTTHVSPTPMRSSAETLKMSSGPPVVRGSRMRLLLGAFAVVGACQRWVQTCCITPVCLRGRAQAHKYRSLAPPP